VPGIHFDMARYGRPYDAIYGVFLVGAAISPSMVGYLFDFTANYRAALTTAAVALSVAALLLTLASPGAVRRMARQGHSMGASLCGRCRSISPTERNNPLPILKSPTS
jgi:hypothetical protein